MIHRKRNSSHEAISLNSIRVICAKCGVIKIAGNICCPEANDRSRSKQKLSFQV